MRRHGLTTVARYALGGLLLVAGGLKVTGGSSAVLPVGPLADPTVQLATVVWEFVLGFWLICSLFVKTAWWATTGTFLAFAGASGYLGVAGRATCGCFGSIPASPWVALGIDLLALAVLAAVRTNWVRTPTTDSASSDRRFTGLYVVAPLAVTAGVVVAGMLYYGSFAVLLAKVRGDGHLLSPSPVDFGEGRTGQFVEREVLFTNLAATPVRLLGGTSDCSCITVDSLPITVDVGKTQPFSIVLKFPEGNGVHTRTATIFTDSRDDPAARLVLTCRVR